MMAAAVSPGIGSFGRGRGRGRGLRANALQQPGVSIPGQCIPPKSSLLETKKGQLSDKSASTTSSEKSPCPDGADTTKLKKSPDVINTTTEKSLCPDGTETTKLKKSPAVTNTTTSEKSHCPGVANTTASEKTHCADVTKIMKKLKMKSSLTESEVITDILPEIEALQSQQVIEDLNNALSEEALLDTTFAVIAAKIADKLWNNESMHYFIRNPLLKQTQDFFNKRELLRKEKKYHGLCVYLCQLFKLLRIRQKPLRPVGDAVVELLKGLIEKSESPSNQDVYIFYVELENVGGIIGEYFPEKLEEVINIARQMVISSSLLPSVRCRLVQVIELHAAKWDMKDELKTLYKDLLHDLKSQEN